MATYYPTVGLEIHAELATKSKMFCACANNPFDSEPNTHICPVCMAHPGTLPVPNAAAIQSVMRVGLAVGGSVADFTEFDRKNYFYPDIPKGYQISQYKYPIVSGGKLAGVDITRVHLEEDTATSQHEGDVSLINYNRAGVPLMELVTEPVIHSAEEAMRFAEELQLLLRTLGVSHANMEKGEMRVEVNISISDTPDTLGTKVEVKNINSFSVAGKAIDYEIKRMSALWDGGKQDEIVQETRGWDDGSQSTFSQRKKEGAADYRYFPEPDIPKLFLHTLYDIEHMRRELPELPDAFRSRYMDRFGLKSDDIEVYVRNRSLAEFFEEVLGNSVEQEFARLTSNYLLSDVVGYARTQNIEVETVLNQLNAEHFAKLIHMIRAGDLSSRGAKDTLLRMYTEDTDPEILAKTHGYIQESNPDILKPIIELVCKENEDAVNEYKAGKEASFKFLIGQAMKASKGSANPTVLEQVLKECLK